MSTKYDYTNRRRLRGTHRVLFALNATAATAYAAPYRDLGNVIDMGIQPTTEKFEDFDMLGGEKVALTPDYLSKITDFNIKLNDIGLENLKLMMRGEDATTISQAEIATAQAIDVLAFSVTPAVLGVWYPLTDGGVPVYRITELTITGLTEGTDFEYLPDMGMVRFLTAQSADLTPSVTAAALSATPFTLGEGDPLSGMIQIRTYVKSHSATEASLLFKPFGAYIEYEEALSIVADSNSEATVKARVTIPAPEVLDFRSAT